MQFTISNILAAAAAAMLIAPALGQNATASNSTDLASLVDQLPECALSCLDKSAASINCTSSDLPCLCGKSDQLVSAIGPCVFTSGCDSSEQSQLSSIATELCTDVSSASPSEIAAASNAVNSAMASASISASSTASGNAAVRTDSPVVGMGVMGAAAALAALAL